MLNIQTESAKVGTAVLAWGHLECLLGSSQGDKSRSAGMYC
jgi:hypothetical protein